MSHKDREKLKLMQRMKKLRGQLDAVERSLAADEDCGGQLMQLAAVRGGVNSLMAEVLETHIRFHLADGAKEQIAPELAEDLIDLVHAYLKGAHWLEGNLLMCRRAPPPLALPLIVSARCRLNCECRLNDASAI